MNHDRQSTEPVVTWPWRTSSPAVQLTSTDQGLLTSLTDPRGNGHSFSYDSLGRVAQRSALLMFTSCGWFFSDLAGIETIQVLRYAARVLDLQGQLGFDSPRTQFLELLAHAKSNRPDQGNGADIFLHSAEPVAALR